MCKNNFSISPHLDALSGTEICRWTLRELKLGSNSDGSKPQLFNYLSQDISVQADCGDVKGLHLFNLIPSTGTTKPQQSERPEPV